MARLFGTDGVRGIANVELTCEMAYRLGQAAAIYLGKTIVVGRDTRRSGDMLGAALSAGIMSAGGTVLEAGIIPTPGVALLVREMRAAGGAVISASHNPPEYNALLFDGSPPDAVEDEIEAFIVNGGLEGEVAAAEEAAPERRLPLRPMLPPMRRAIWPPRSRCLLVPRWAWSFRWKTLATFTSTTRLVPSRIRAFPSRACASLWIRATVLPRSRPRRLCDAWAPR